MDPKTLTFVIVVVAVIIIAAIVFIVISRKRRTQHLRQQFGPEYDRIVQQRGDASRAETELINRERRVHSFTIKPLSATARERYAEDWATVQRRFVDDPAVAVNEADSLVNRVMEARGYPVADFEQRADDVSVIYPEVVQNYRGARIIVQRHSRGEAGTEDLRQAMVHYRSLFDELLDTKPAPATGSRGVFHERAS